MSLGLILRSVIGFVIGYFIIPKIIRAIYERLYERNAFNDNKDILNDCKLLLTFVHNISDFQHDITAVMYFFEKYESIVKYINKRFLSNKKRKTVIHELQKVDCYIAKNFDYKSSFYKKHLELMNKYANAKKFKGGILL